MANEAPSMTAPTYAKKRQPRSAPNPGREAAQQMLDEIDAARSRALHQRANKIGWLAALGLAPEKPKVTRRV